MVDIGASYLTARDDTFKGIVDEACAEGVLRPWTDTFHVADPGGITGVRTGPMRFAAPGGLRSFPTWLARDLTITSEHIVDRVERDGSALLVDSEPIRAVALCMPDPQAERMLEPDLLATSGMVWEPVIAVTAVFDERCWQELDGVFVNDDPVLTWIADDGSRRGDDAPVLVAHVNPVFAAGHLEQPKEVLPAAIAALTRVLDISQAPVWIDAMRWTFARPIEARSEPCVMHAELPLGLAGDAWHEGPRVEAAWASGNALGLALAERLIHY
jgi:renalase